MKTLIVYAHPYKKSFNNAILKQTEKSFKETKREYEIIDLYADNFDPSYTKDELAVFKYGKTLDPLVEKYQQKISQANKLIFIFPIWWNEMPAVVKGFIDKVMKMNFAYTVTKYGLEGKLNNIENALVFSTSTSPTFYLKMFCGNAIKKVFLNSTLKQIGIKNRKWVNFGSITNSTPKLRENYLNSIPDILKKF